MSQHVQRTNIVESLHHLDCKGTWAITLNQGTVVDSRATLVNMKKLNPLHLGPAVASSCDEKVPSLAICVCETTPLLSGK